MLTQLCICLLSPASNGGVDINLELWPARVRAAKNLALGNATYKGLLGYNGRSGWFVAERSFSCSASTICGTRPNRSPRISAPSRALRSALQ